MQPHPALSFCRVQERHVFLDLARDRYFCLGSELEAAWSAWLAGSANEDESDRLVSSGLIVRASDMPVSACIGQIAEASLLDGDSPPASLARMAALAWGLARTRRILRQRGISAATAALSTARSSARPCAADRDALAAIACDFERLSLLTGSHNLCLPRSLALGLHLARAGYAAEVVLGVRLGPFRAHCWTECGGLLVNDRFERVCHYTPIRRL